MTEKELFDEFPRISQDEQNIHNIELLKKYEYYLETEEDRIWLMPPEPVRKASITKTQAILHGDRT